MDSSSQSRICALSLSCAVVVCSRAALVLTMSSKLSAPSTPESSEKRRKVLTLAKKTDVIGMVDSSQGWTATGKKFGLHEAIKK